MYPYEDNRLLNSNTTHGRYPLLNIHDFNTKLSGSQMFSKIDLIRAHLEISTNPEKFQKMLLRHHFYLIMSVFPMNHAIRAKDSNTLLMSFSMTLNLFMFIYITYLYVFITKKIIEDT